MKKLFLLLAVVFGSLIVNGQTDFDKYQLGDLDIKYEDISSSLAGTVSNNTLTWDLSAGGIIYSVPASSGTVSFTNYESNKQVLIILNLTGGVRVTWPSNVKVVNGSAAQADGQFFVYLHCISETLIIVSLIQAT